MALFVFFDTDLRDIKTDLEVASERQQRQHASLTAECETYHLSLQRERDTVKSLQTQISNAQHQISDTYENSLRVLERDITLSRNRALLLETQLSDALRDNDSLRNEIKRLGELRRDAESDRAIIRIKCVELENDAAVERRRNQVLGAECERLAIALMAATNSGTGSSSSVIWSKNSKSQKRKRIIHFNLFF